MECFVCICKKYLNLFMFMLHNDMSKSIFLYFDVACNIMTLFPSL